MSWKVKETGAYPLRFDIYRFLRGFIKYSLEIFVFLVIFFILFIVGLIVFSNESPASALTIFLQLLVQGKTPTEYVGVLNPYPWLIYFTAWVVRILGWLVVPVLIALAISKAERSAEIREETIDAIDEMLEKVGLNKDYRERISNELKDLLK